MFARLATILKNKGTVVPPLVKASTALFGSANVHQSYNNFSSVSKVDPTHKETTILKLVKSPVSQQWDSRKPNTDLDCVGGNEEVINSLSDIVRYLQDPNAFTQMGIIAPRGIILSGPPGVGKTMMAEAVAGHAGVPIIIISGPEILSQYVGSAEKNLRELFAAAREAAPCVLCIDEIDSIAPKRFSSANKTSSEHHINTLVDQLLSLLTQDNSQVIVIGTTNSYNSLDPAVVRPGRFDRHVYVNLPDLTDRIRILKIHTKDKKLNNVPLDDLAKLSVNFSGAKLAAWVNEAAMCASRDGSKAISKSHFDQARSILEHGVSDRRIHDPQQKKKVANHEIGHALVGHLLGVNLYKVSIMGSGTDFGFTEFLPKDEQQNQTKEEVLNHICVTLSGRAADELFGTSQLGCKEDFDKAKILAHTLIEEGMGSSLSGINISYDVEAILKEQMNRAKGILQENKKHHERLTDALINNDELHYDEFVDIFNDKKLFSSTCLIPSFFKTAGRNNLDDRKKSFLPPKKEFKPTGKNNNQSIDMKYLLPSIGEVAKAFCVDASSIREIKSDNSKGCYIVFKPSFAGHAHMEDISKDLKHNDVENIYFGNRVFNSDNPELHVYSKGMSDFIKYIKTKNQSNTPSNDSYRGFGM